MTLLNLWWKITTWWGCRVQGKHWWSKRFHDDADGCYYSTQCLFCDKYKSNTL